jgi:hypothetical protein
MADEKLISRRGLFIVSFQAEGVCLALRLVLQTGAPVSAPTRVIVAKLRSDFQSLIANGRVAEGLPEVSEDMGTAELLTLAEIIRMSVLCFLTPDETEERKRTMGFLRE